MGDRLSGPIHRPGQAPLKLEAFADLFHSESVREEYV